MTYGCICIVYPQFAARPISDAAMADRFGWWGPTYERFVYTETTSSRPARRWTALTMDGRKLTATT